MVPFPSQSNLLGAARSKIDAQGTRKDRLLAKPAAAAMHIVILRRGDRALKSAALPFNDNGRIGKNCLDRRGRLPHLDADGERAGEMVKDCLNDG